MSEFLKKENNPATCIQTGAGTNNGANCEECIFDCDYSSLPIFEEMFAMMENTEVER